MRLYANQPVGTVSRARALRREAPAPERRLLRALRETFPHLKWRHQVPVGRFFADILCFSERLVIEVDGETHVASVRNDADRAAFMAREGFRTLRFDNGAVMEQLEGVLARIALALGDAPASRRREKGAAA